MNPKLLYQIALTQINGVGDVIARNLLDIVGDEEAIFKSNRKSLSTIQGISHKLVDEILNPEVLRKAEKELSFVEKNKLQTYFIKDDNYPLRMRECADVPVLFYLKGNVDLNAPKVIGIVGTRKSTDYGNTFCRNFLEEIAHSFPDTLIVSGLAYGVDIQSHRAAMDFSLPTLGVLAHGLDRIYPAAHRQSAIKMLEHGGLLTEFPSETEPDKFNFVRRNRIIAALSDAVVVVESDVKGGSLITADIANSYNKEVFAVPGKITDTYSSGCNKLIADNKAIIFHSTTSFIQQMNWEQSNGATSLPSVQKSLFIDLNKEEQLIYDLLSTSDSIHVNFISMETGIAISQLFFNLLEMEMKGIIKPLPGSLYKLV